MWNTFWTRGVCPGCGHQWRETACLQCRKKSPHESWYHYPDGEDESADDSEIELVEIETVLALAARQGRGAARLTSCGNA